MSPSKSSDQTIWGSGSRVQDQMADLSGDRRIDVVQLHENGNLYAFDADNGKELWRFNAGSGVRGGPVSYAVNGKQYIAVVSGYGVDAQWIQGKMHGLAGWDEKVPEGGSVWVFALGN